MSDDKSLLRKSMGTDKRSKGSAPRAPKKPALPEANRVISPDVVCPWCGNEDMEDGADPEWADWDAVTASAHCTECGGQLELSYALVDVQPGEPPEGEVE